MSFTEGYRIELLLTIDGKPHTVPTSNVESFSVRLTSYGFDASLVFWLEDDKAYGGTKTDLLVSPFLKHDLIDVKMTLNSTYQEQSQDEAWPLVLQGIGTEKKLFEQVSEGVSDHPVMQRRYTLRFADPATVLWKQHWPTQLYVDKTLKDVIDDHKGSKIKITVDSSDATKKKAVQFLGLGAFEGLPRPSFYDFLIERTAHLWHFLTYDSALNTYKLLKTRSDPTSPVLIHSDDVESVRVHFPNTRRYAPEVLNSYTEGAKTNAITNSNAVSGLVHSVLLRTPITGDVTARKTLETNRIKAAEHEIELDFKRHPTIALLPGFLYKLTGSLWGTKQYTVSHTYRLWQLELTATNEKGGQPTLGDEVASFLVECKGRFESKDHPHARLPDHVPPVYPVEVEGKVLSEEGDESVETFQVYTDSTTSIDQYKVKIPLWKDQTVVAPYEPNSLPGQMFFPLLKDARVLVALTYDTAWIVRSLDWRPGAQQPMDGQGNHILFGKSATSQTSLSHTYAESKPTFELRRINEKDTGSISLSEGSMVFEVKEDD